MRKTKLNYHYSVRKLKRDSDNLRKRKMAESIQNNKSRDFWSEVKKVNGTCTPIAVNIGDKTDSYDIAELFANKYNSLYNSVPSDTSVINDIKAETRQKLSVNSFVEMEVKSTDIIKAVKGIKKNKSDDEGKLFSNHIIFASKRFYDYTAHLFNGMLIHGYTPKCLLNSTIISIPKDTRGDLSSDENYRGISLCSSLFKLFELILIQKQNCNLTTSDMQFAYKLEHSTTMATVVLKDVVYIFLLRNSNVYCCFIDASKAFDRLRHDMLFKMLLMRNVNPLMVRILMESYERQTVRTSWLNKTSKSFSCKNGVRQGGILSPILYSIYNDELLQRLKNNGDGCWVGNHFFGALSYADDLCIMSPTLTGLQNMLQLCEIYGKEYDVMYNSSKTKCMKFSKQVQNVENMPDVNLCGQSLKWVQSFKYLGNWISSDLSEEFEINKKLGIFYGSVNNLYSSFRNIGVNHLGMLFNSYCCVFYGSQAWSLSDKNVDKIYVAWNKAVRHICNIPYNTHTLFLPFLVKTLCIRDELYLRSAKMINTMLHSNNASMKFLAEWSINSYVTIIGRNRKIISDTLCCELQDANIKKNLFDKLSNTFTLECHMIRELLDIRDGNIDLPGFTIYDVHDILHNVCIN
jgi:hypothetical protein